MVKKLSKQEENTISLAKKLHKEGKSIEEIHKKLNISYQTTFVYTKGFKSVAEYQKDLLKRKYGLTRSEYRKYKELEKNCKGVVLRLTKNLRRVGYDIRELKEEKGEIVIKLSEEEKELDKCEVERNFKESLQEFSQAYLQAIGTKNNENKFEVSYRKNTVFIKVKNSDDLESRVCLSFYGLRLKREVVKE